MTRVKISKEQRYAALDLLVLEASFYARKKGNEGKRGHSRPGCDFGSFFLFPSPF